MISFMTLNGLGVLALLVLVAILIEQLASLIRAAPGVLRGARETLLDMFEPLSELELLQGTSYEFMTSLGQDLVGLAQNAAQQVLGSLIGFVSVTFGVALSLFAPPFRHERRGCHLSPCGRVILILLAVPLTVAVGRFAYRILVFQARPQGARDRG